MGGRGVIKDPNLWPAVRGPGVGGRAARTGRDEWPYCTSTRDVHNPYKVCLGPWTGGPRATCRWQCYMFLSLFLSSCHMSILKTGMSDVSIICTPLSQATKLTSPVDFKK